MRGIVKWLVRIVLALILAAVVLGLWKREEITRLLAVNTLFDADRIVHNFSHMDAAFLTTPVPRGDGPTAELPYGESIELPPEVADWVAARTVTALVVLKDGAVVFEDYFQGTSSTDRRIGFSVSKSYLSALIGILLDEGQIGSLDDPVVQYAPSLKGRAYDRATIRDVLEMESGVKFNEDYLDYDSDINRMGRVLALGRRMDAFAADLTETVSPPGEAFRYVSINTHVLGMVVRGATGRPVPELLSEKIIQPMGLEYPPYYLTDGVGTAFVLGGLNLTTRDYARFGQMFLQDGLFNGRQIVPADWVAASTTPSARTEPGAFRYGLHWWIPKDGDGDETLARGIYGQYIYLDKTRRVVVASNAADRGFREPGVSDSDIAAFRALARAASEGR